MTASSSGSPARPRPLSPHLQIYRWQLPMLTSILHRATGIALAVGSLLLVCWIISAANGPAAFASVQAFMGSWFGLLILFGWTVALFYHLGNGLRHLGWDLGYGLDLKGAYASGYAVFIFTAAATVLTWCVGIMMMGGK